MSGNWKWIGKTERMNCVGKQIKTRSFCKRHLALGDSAIAFVRADGTLWALNRYWDQKHNFLLGSGVLQVGNDNDWRSVAVNYDMMVALKSDGSLWQWNFREGDIVSVVHETPTRLGIHNDWVAITGNWDSTIALAGMAACGFGRTGNSYGYEMLVSLPKQPERLGNVFGTGKLRGRRPFSSLKPEMGGFRQLRDGFIAKC